jgi:hypothetical protein
MAELYWAAQPYELSEAAEDIGDVYDGLTSAMEQAGWEGVQHGVDVHGYKPGIDLFAAVEFLWQNQNNPDSDTRWFWQVIMVGGDATEAQAQQEISGLQQLIANLVFF